MRRGVEVRKAAAECCRVVGVGGALQVEKLARNFFLRPRVQREVLGECLDPAALRIVAVALDERDDLLLRELGG